MDLAMGGGNCGSPAVGTDGTIYVENGDLGYLYAMSASGSQKWSYQTAGGNGSPAIGADGGIYINGYHFLHAVSPYGTNRWTYRVGGDVLFASPSVGTDGTIYINSRDV